MSHKETFSNILNECLDRILKGETVEQCLRVYPEHAQELEPLLRTAKAAITAASVQPRPEFKAEASRQFQASLIEMKVKQNECRASTGSFWQWRWKSAWAVSLMFVIIIVLGGAGTVTAAGNSMPDSSLYSVKLVAERVQLALTPGEMARTKLNAKFADRRTDEIVYTANKGDVQEVQKVASRLNINLSNITELAAGNVQPVADSRGESAPLMEPKASGLSDNSPQPMKSAVSAPPPAARPGPGAAGAPAAAARSSAPSVTPSAAPFAAQSTENSGALKATAKGQDANGSSTEKDANVHSAKYEIMRKIIQDNFDKRKQKLEETLKKSTPAVRPAIRQAIAQSDLEYERTLKNLEETENAENQQNSPASKNSKNLEKTPSRQLKRN